MCDKAFFNLIVSLKMIELVPSLLCSFRISNSPQKFFKVIFI